MAFPTSPTNGQLAVINGINYQYSSADNAWKRITLGYDTLTANNLTVNANITTGNLTATGKLTSASVYTNGLYWASNGAVISTGGTGSAIVVKDEGTTLTSGATSFNFVGTNVTATNIGTDVTVTISGGGGTGLTYTANTVPPTTGNVKGDQWYNTTTNVLYEYIYDGINYYWVDIQTPVTGNVTTGYVSRTFTTDGSANTYTISTGCAVTNVLVFLNGVAQTPTTDYTISGSTLTLVETPAASQILQVRELPR